MAVGNVVKVSGQSFLLYLQSAGAEYYGLLILESDKLNLVLTRDCLRRKMKLRDDFIVMPLKMLYLKAIFRY